MVRWLVDHATTVLVSVVIVFVFGLVSYRSLPRESAPDIEIPFVIVSTPYVGVSPADVEGLITIPLENELASLTDVKHMTSSSSEGISVVAIEFEPEVDIDEALQKVRDRVNRARPELPADAEDPSVSEVSFSDIPILLVTLAGGLDEQGLKRLAEGLEDEVVRLPGVLGATVTGGREREVRVQVEPERLGHYGLSLSDVVGAIGNENVNIPGGDVRVGGSTILLRTPGEFTEPAQVEGVAIKRVGDRPVFVRDVARVVDGFEERLTYSRLEGTPSVTLAVKKRTGANMLGVAEAVRSLVAERAATWPDGVSYRILADQSEYVDAMVLDLQNNIITALLLVAGLLLFFMGARNAGFVALAIPLSMLASFIVVEALGFTLNMVVLFALILALGMLVDNGIVVVENVYRHLEMGKSLRDAAVDGTGEVAVAVTSSTATTVAAFLPLVFWTGIMGEFMGYLPKVVIIVLTASLAVALWVLPVLLSRFARLPEGQGALADDDATPLDPARLSRPVRAYHRVLAGAIGHPWLSTAGGIAVLVVTFVIYGAANHGVEFFPAPQPDRAVVAVRLPEGADLEATDRVVRRIEGSLATMSNLDTWVAEVGVAAGDPLLGANHAANHARVSVDFLPAADKVEEGETPRVENTFVTIARLRAAFSAIPGAEISVAPEEMGPPVGDPISVQVSGEDFHEVGRAALALERAIEEQVPGVAELESDYRVGRPELRLRVDRGAAKRVGVSTAGVGSAVRTAVAGEKASALREGEEEHDIVVEVAPEARRDLQRVLALRLPGREDTSPDTFPVPLSAVASYELAGGTGTVRHLDQELVVTISGDVERKDEEAMVREQVAAFVAAWDAPHGIHAELGGAADEQAESMAFLSWAFALALALVFLVLVVQFDSLLVPGIIMFTVVLSLVGVLWGLLLTGTPFGIMMTGLGVISLAGVVVNNAIVLLDFVQQLQARGLDTRHALLRSGVTRLRPVLLTAVTTILGLLPMALAVNVDFVNLRFSLGSSSAQFWGPMAVAVIAGLMFATVLTLVMVPTLYALYDDVLVRVSGWWGRRPGPRLASAAKVLLAGLVGAGLLVPGEAGAVSLAEALAAAERHNVDVRLQEEQEAQARSQRWQTLSAVLPRVNVGATYTVNQEEVVFDPAADFGAAGGDIDPALFTNLVTHPDSPFTPDYATDALAPLFEALIPSTDGLGEPVVIQPKTVWTGALSIYQPLINGQSIPAFRAATSAWRASRADTATVRQSIRGAVARTYYALSASRDAVQVAEQALALTRSQQELAQRQVQAGLADELAEMQARLAVSSAERDVLLAREQVVTAEQAFVRLTGLPGQSVLEEPPPIEVPASVEAALATAQEARPDLEAAEHRVRAIRSERIARELEWLPTVDLTFTEIYNQTPGFNPNNFQWQLGLGFNWNLFDGGLRLFRSPALASRVRAAQLAVDRVRQDAVEQVTVSWERLGRAQAAYDVVLEEVSLAEETLTRAEARFSAGRATWLDVERARLSLENARYGVVRERMNRDLAAIDLLTATGRY